MITGGIATVYVSDLDRAVDFYTNTLGLKLVQHVPQHWAQVDAGKGSMIGLHPAGPHSPRPGAQGAISIGFFIDNPIDGVYNELVERGVIFTGPPQSDGPVELAFFTDPDGNPLYLCSYTQEPLSE